jgi:hypothetical protein
VPTNSVVIAVPDLIQDDPAIHSVAVGDAGASRSGCPDQVRA